MFSSIKSWWAKFAVLVVCVVIAALTTSSAAIAGPNCRKVNGKFSLQPVTGPACTSSVGICASGSYKGDLAGTSTFTGTSLIQTVDTPTTSVVLLTGDTLIQAKGGNLLTKDAIVLKTTGAGNFAEIDTVISGTGEWAGATGQISALGTFTTANGGEGDYSGEICTP